MSQHKRPLIIGVTGSIGSGKTTVCSIIEKNYPVFYTDSITQELLDTPLIQEVLIQEFGNTLIINDKIDRKHLADIVFKNKSNLDYLNNLIHPKVLKAIQALVDNCSKKYIFIEVPLLFEFDLQSCFDFILLVVTSLKNRSVRLRQGKGFTKQEVVLRNQYQLSENIKKLKSDYIIYNDHSKDILTGQVEHFLTQINTIKYRDITPFYSLQ